MLGCSHLREGRLALGLSPAWGASIDGISIETDARELLAGSKPLHLQHNRDAGNIAARVRSQQNGRTSATQSQLVPMGRQARARSSTALNPLFKSTCGNALTGHGQGGRVSPSRCRPSHPETAMTRNYDFNQGMIYQACIGPIGMKLVCLWISPA